MANEPWVAEAQKLLETQVRGVPRVNEQTGIVTYESMPDCFTPHFVHQRQPSEFSCLPTAFAMVMSLSAKAVVARLGHDDARGFHPQELLTIGLEVGWIFSPHDFTPLMDELACTASECRHGKVVKQVNVFGDFAEFDCERCEGLGVWKLHPRLTEMSDLLNMYDGVLTGRTKPNGMLHAVAWCYKIQKCLDPQGAIYSLDGFDPDTFWLAVKR